MRPFPLLLVLFLLASPLGAQTLGETTFANSGAAEAQEPFLRGLLLLHSFEYDDARAAFQEARRLDPAFAMAAWGEAMTYNHPIWMEQDLEAARQALDGITMEGLTERERAYLHTLDVLYGDGDKEDRDDAYAQAMEALSRAYPDDLDAAALYALSILGTAHEGRDFATYMRAAAVAEEVFDQNPRHPGAAHYLIHAYDDPVHAPLGLRAARAYSGIAPDASHALHMPSHIYVALGQWDEAVALNVRSFEAAQARDAAHNEPGGGHGWHALYWRNYAELQRGRFDESRRLVQQAQTLYEAAPSRRAAYHLIAMRANHLVETEDWDGAVAQLDLRLEEAEGSTALRNAFVNGLAALHREDMASAAAMLTEVQALRDAMEETSLADQASAQMLEGLMALHAGETATALEQLREAAYLEDQMPLDFGPPHPVKPAHELLGEVLLELGQAAEAQVEFEKALARAPRRMRALMGLAKAADASGDAETARLVRQDLAAMLSAADASVRENLGYQVPAR